MDDGAVGARGGKLFSAAQSKEMWSAQTILPIKDLPKGAPAVLRTVQPQFNAYGLGWTLRDYRGRKMVFHTGTLAGYVSRTTLIPELNLGVVVLTNQEEDGRAYLDRLLGARPLPGSARDRLGRGVSRADETRNGGRRGRSAPHAAATRNADSHPSLPLAAYAGRYRDAWYGDVRDRRARRASLRSPSRTRRN